MVLILKKIFFSVLICFASVFLLGETANAADISARCAIVYAPQTGDVLYEKSPDARMLIASTTKIMTALVVLEHCDPDEIVKVTPAHAAMEGSSMYLKPGETYTVEEVLYGLMLVSGNDAAAALADHVAGSMEGFAALMNAKCEQLGLKNTHFANAHGLDAQDHYSTARELALLTAKAMENPEFCKIFESRSFSCHGVSYYNHNKLLSTCEGCIGGKTGYTEKAGRILVSCVEREGLRLICVTISDPRDWADHTALYDEAFAAYRIIRLPEAPWQRLELISGTQNHVSLKCGKEAVLVPKQAKVEFSLVLPRFAYAPTLIGTPAGFATLFIDGEAQEKLDIFYAESVPVNGEILLTPWERFKRVWFLTNKFSGGVYYPDF